MRFSLDSSVPPKLKKLERLPEFEQQLNMPDDYLLEDGVLFRKTDRSLHGHDLSPRVWVDQEGVWHIADYQLAKSIFQREEKLEQVFAPAPAVDVESTAAAETAQKGKRFQLELSAEQLTSIDRMVETLIEDLQQFGLIDLSEYTLKIAIQTVSELVGLIPETESGRHTRMSDIVYYPNEKLSHAIFGPLHKMNRWRYINRFYQKDILPAIQYHAKHQKTDAAKNRGGRIPQLLGGQVTQKAILEDALVYADMGIRLTREFMNSAFLYLMRAPNLKAAFPKANEATRLNILSEILRLEPVVPMLTREAETDIELPLGENGTGKLTIPAGSKINVDIYRTNLDDAIIGTQPTLIQPDREHDPEVPRYVMSFGGGATGCPAAQVALQVTDLLLHRLLQLPGLRIRFRPEINFNEYEKRYEIRNLILTADSAESLE